MKKIMLLLLSAMLLQLTGCGSDDTANCRFEVQQDLDQGNFDAVISRLTSDQACVDTYQENEHYIDLASAYLGKSGLTLTEVLSVLLEEDNEEFTQFIESLAASANDSVLRDLDLSAHAYQNYLGQRCSELDTPTSTQKNICLLAGFVDVLKASMAIEQLASDVDKWINSDDPADKYPMEMATCALEFAALPVAEQTLPYYCLSSAAVVESSTSVTFDYAEGSEDKTYNSLYVTRDNVDDYFLADAALGTTIFTDGYCTAAFDACDKGADSCYACPPLTNVDTQYVVDVLVEALNNGLDSVALLATDNDEVRQSIEDFKDEIKPGGGTITLQDVLDYLNNI